MTSTVAVGLGVELGNRAVVTVGILAKSSVDRVGCLISVPWGVAAGLRQASVTISIARSLAGNPDSPQAVVFLTSIID